MIGSRDLQVELENMDPEATKMESVNLFGVDVSSHSDEVLDNLEKRKRNTSQLEVKQILMDLVQMVTEMDPQGTTRDFSKRKAFAYYDPYNPDKTSSFAHLRYEDDAKMRASLIVRQHLESLQEIDE